jgi:hypothetical protein
VERVGLTWKPLFDEPAQAIANSAFYIDLQTISQMMRKGRVGWVPIPGGICAWPMPPRRGARCAIEAGTTLFMEAGGADQFSQSLGTPHGGIVGFNRPASSPTGSIPSTLQCTDLARELIEIDVVTSDDVPIGVTNQEVVSEHFPLHETARFG